MDRNGALHPHRSYSSTIILALLAVGSVALLTGVSIGAQASAPTDCEEPGPDAFNYRCQRMDSEYEWLTPSDWTELDIPTDGVSDPVDLGFQFAWYDGQETQVNVSSKGFVCFTRGTDDCVQKDSQEVPDPDDPNDLVACVWENLNPEKGTVRHGTTTTGDGVTAWVVEFDDVPHRGTDDGNTFQIQLLEDGTARCAYEELLDDGDGNEVGVGIENATGETGVRYTKSEFSVGTSEDVAVVFGQTPSVPENLTAIPGIQEIEVSWDPPSDGTPTEYTVYKRASPGASPETITVDGDTTTYLDDELGDEETWFYNVSASNDMGEGPVSDQVNATTFGAPSRPLNVAADHGSDTGEIEITWDAPEAENATTTYNVYRNGSDSPVASVDGDQRSFNDTDLSPGIAYTYNVTAENAVGEGPHSEDATGFPAGPPSAPSAVSVTNNETADHLTVSWGPPSSDGGAEITEYELDRSVDNGTFGFRASVDGSTLHFNDTAIDCNTFYTFNVTAINEHGESPPSQASRLAVAPCGPPVRNLAAEQNDTAGAIDVSWDPPEEGTVTNYDLDRSVAGAAYEDVAETTQTSASDGDLVCGAEIEYRVIAEFEASNDSKPATTTILPNGVCPSEVRNLTTTVNGTAAAFNLTWDAPDDPGLSELTHYHVFRSTDGGPFASLGDVDLADAELGDEDITCGESYTYRVTANNTYGGTPNATVQSAENACPSEPTDLTAAEDPAVGAVVVDWAAPNTTGFSDLTTYELERKQAGGSFTDLATVNDPTNVTTYNDTAVDCDATYTYRLVATNTFGTGPGTTATATVTTACPSAPQGVQADAGENQGTPADAIEVTWTPPTDTGWTDLTGFVVERCDEDGVDCSQDANWNQLATTDAGTTSYTDGGLGPEETFAYRVIAQNGNGASDASPNATATTASPPGVPQNVVVDGDEDPTANGTPAPTDAPTISWEAPEDDGGADLLTYHVYRKPLLDAATDMGDWTLVTTVPADQTTATDEEAPAPGACYRVSADNTFEGEMSPFDPQSTESPALVTKCTTATGAGGDPIPDPDACGLTDGTVPVCPGAPQNTDAAADLLDVNVSWEAPEDDLEATLPTEELPDGLPAINLTYYEVYQGTSADCADAELVENTTDTSVERTGLDAATTYCFEVRSMRGVVTEPTGIVEILPGERTDPVFATTAGPPGAPQNLAVDDATLGQADLTWDAPADDGGSAITEYTVYRDVSCTGSFSELDTVPAGTTSYTDVDNVPGDGEGLPAGDYCYEITATNTIDEGPASKVAQAAVENDPPTTPTNVAASNANPGTIDVSWSPPSATGGSALFEYRVERKAQDGSWEALDPVEGDTTSLTDDGLAQGVEFCYRLTAVNTAHDEDGQDVPGLESELSQEACATA